MKTLNYTNLSIDSLIVPGGLRDVLKSRHATAIGVSLEHVDIIHEPVVRLVNKKHVLLCGRNRVAGAQLTGRKEVMCKVIECTDKEAQDVIDFENITRRHDTQYRDRLLKERIDRLEKAEKKAPLEKRKPGRPKEARTKAQEKVAKQEGITQRAVAQRERRAEIRKAPKKRKHRAMGPPAIKLWGMEVEEDFADKMERIRDELMAASGLLAQAKAAVGKAEIAGMLGVPTDRLQKYIAAAASEVRGHIPIALCPYCKAWPEVRDSCKFCDMEGYVGKGKPAPNPQLMDEYEHFVMYQGRLRTIEDIEKDDDLFG